VIVDRDSLTSMEISRL